MFVEESAQAGLRLRTLPFTAFRRGVAGRRQRRPARSRDRQRRGDAHGRSAGPPTSGSVFSSAGSCSATWASGRFEEITGSRGLGVHDRRRAAAARHSAISTTTATPTSSSANDNGPVRVLVNEIGSRSQLDWVEAGHDGRSKGPALATAVIRSGRASRSPPGRDADETCPSGWQLRVRERSAGARWPRHDGLSCSRRAGFVAQRTQRAVVRHRGGQVLDAHGRHGRREPDAGRGKTNA